MLRDFTYIDDVTACLRAMLFCPPKPDETGAPNRDLPVTGMRCTTAGNPSSWEMAGRKGLGLLGFSIQSFQQADALQGHVQARHVGVLVRVPGDPLVALQYSRELALVAAQQVAEVALGLVEVQTEGVLNRCR